MKNTQGAQQENPPQHLKKHKEPLVHYEKTPSTTRGGKKEKATARYSTETIQQHNFNTVGFRIVKKSEGGGDSPPPQSQTVTAKQVQSSYAKEKTS